MKGLSDKGTARQKAAADLVHVLSGEADLSTCDQIAQQGDQTVLYDQEYQGFADLMAGMECLRESDVVKEAVDQPRNHFRWRQFAVAASLLLCCMSLMWWMAGSPEGGVSKMDRYVTRVGEQRQVALDDGSVIHLNTNSELLVTEGSNKRHVVLRRGEAFFDVEKSESNPFSVEVSNRVVTVLGTSFNVRFEPDSLTVDVATGAVAIHKPNEAVFVNLQSFPGDDKAIELPGDSQVKLVGGQMATVSTSDGPIQLASSAGGGGWRTGRLEFKQVPLYLVVKELNRYSAKKILIEDKSIVELPVSAMVSVDRIHVLLSGFGKAWGIKVTSYPDRIVLVSQ